MVNRLNYIIEMFSEVTSCFADYVKCVMFLLFKY